MCEPFITAKYTKRPSPPMSAVACEGRTEVGNDGALWLSSRVGAQRAATWKRVPHAASRSLRKTSPHRRDTASPRKASPHKASPTRRVPTKALPSRSTVHGQTPSVSANLTRRLHADGASLTFVTASDKYKASVTRSTDGTLEVRATKPRGRTVLWAEPRAAQVWVGHGAYTDTHSTDALGNSLLVVAGSRVTLIGEVVAQFNLHGGERVTAFVSTVGNSLAAYPYVVTNQRFVSFSCARGGAVAEAVSKRGFSPRTDKEDMIDALQCPVHDRSASDWKPVADAHMIVE